MEYVIFLMLVVLIVLILVARYSLLDKLDRLEREIGRLREELRKGDVAAPPKAAPIEMEPFRPAPRPVPQSSPRPIPQPVQAKKPTEPVKATAPTDWEKFIGENLVSKIGIAVLVLAIGFFVKYAIDNDWIGPLGRVGVGLICGTILIGLAHRLRNQYKAFSSVQIGRASCRERV